MYKLLIVLLIIATFFGCSPKNQQHSDKATEYDFAEPALYSDSVADKSVLCFAPMDSVEDSFCIYILPDFTIVYVEGDRDSYSLSNSVYMTNITKEKTITISENDIMNIKSIIEQIQNECWNKSEIYADLPLLQVFINGNLYCERTGASTPINELHEVLSVFFDIS